MLWTDIFEQFEKIVNDFFPNETLIENKIFNLYSKHKGQPNWDFAYLKWTEE